MNALSLFSGIGGIDLACDWAGIKTVAFCEREPFCQKVLRKHWPDTPIYDDVCTLTKERLEADGIGAIDIIHGGYPCQPFSLAGKREGADDDRHLWPEVFRLIQALNPRWFVGENVAGHITLGLDVVLSNLESIGYAWETFVIPACAVNAPHRRERVFIMAYSKSEQDRWLQLGRVVSDSAARSRTEDVANTNSFGRMEYKRLTEEIQSSWDKTLQRKESKQSIVQQPLHSDHKDVAYSPSEGLPERRQAGISEVDTKTGAGLESESERCRDGREWWTTEPDVGRVANGVPHRVDRLKALGNAVVPQQIYPILAAIKQIDNMLSRGEEA